MRIRSKSTRSFAAPGNPPWWLSRAQQSRQLRRLSDNEHGLSIKPFHSQGRLKAIKTLQTKLYHEKDVIIIMTRVQEKKKTLLAFRQDLSQQHPDTYRCSRRSIHRAKENPKYCLALHELLLISVEKGPFGVWEVIATIMVKNLRALFISGAFSNLHKPNPSPHPTNNVGLLYPEFFS